MGFSSMYYILILFFVTTNLFSQNNWEVQISPRPYEGKPYYGNIVLTPLKKVTSITQKLENQFKNDTTTVFNYNKKGLIVNKLSYHDGKVESKNTFRYDEKDVYLGINEEQLNKSSVNSYSRISYNKNKIRDTEYNCAIKNKDTIQRVLIKYTYNDQNQLIERADFFKNELSLKSEYTYNNKLLTTKRSFNYPYSSTRYSETQLSYSSLNLLSSEIDLEINNSKIDTISTVHYSHVNGQLSEQNLIMLMPKKEIDTKYTYNSSKDLESIFVIRDLDTLKVQYSYDLSHKRISKKVEINTKNSFPECSIPLNLSAFNSKTSFEYKEEYLYDKKGNIVEIGCLLNGDLVKKVIYVLEYF